MGEVMAPLRDGTLVESEEVSGVVVRVWQMMMNSQHPNSPSVELLYVAKSRHNKLAPDAEDVGSDCHEAEESATADVYVDACDGVARYCRHRWCDSRWKWRWRHVRKPQKVVRLKKNKNTHFHVSPVETLPPSPSTVSVNIWPFRRFKKCVTCFCADFFHKKYFSNPKQGFYEFVLANLCTVTPIFATDIL